MASVFVNLYQGVKINKAKAVEIVDEIGKQDNIRFYITDDNLHITDFFNEEVKSDLMMVFNDNSDDFILCYYIDGSKVMGLNNLHEVKNHNLMSIDDFEADLSLLGISVHVHIPHELSLFLYYGN